MLGVVRVYSRKVNYLFQDCSEALVKIKQAFKQTSDVDLPEGAGTAQHHTITLPENYDDLELFFEPNGGQRDGSQVDGADADQTLEGGSKFADDVAFEEQYTYDDRIHGDVEDDFIVDEMDPAFHPTPGYVTPGAPPRPFGETDANDRVDLNGMEGYDEADLQNAFPQQSESGGDFGGGGFGDHDDDDGDMPAMDNRDETETETDVGSVRPLPLDEDLTDENGVRGTVVGFKTPGDTVKGSSKHLPDGKENAPTTGGSTVVLEWGKTAQKANRPEPAKRARSRAKTTTMKLKFDSSTILDRDSVSRAIKNAGDITIQRVPGVIRRVTDLADDDMPFGADEEKDENGKATLGYFRDAHGGCRPPDTPGEARSLLRGTSGHRDPLMGHRCSAEWLVMRAGCIRSLMERAGERRGGGFAAHRQKGRRQGGGSRAGSAAGSVRGEDDDVARAMEFDEDDGGDFGGGFGGEDDDDAGGYDDGNDDVPMTPTTTRRNDAAQNAADALNGSDQLPVPPTPAGVVSGHVDWSVATKRMLASLGPRLEEREVVDEKTGEIVVPVPVTVSEMCLARDANNSLKKVKKADAARTFYQVLVLKTHGFVELTQKGAYRDIEIVAGKKLVEQR